MSRNYADPIMVEPTAGLPEGRAPRAFTWRRRRYRVRRVLQRWNAVGNWWRTAEAVDREYRLWRVEADRYGACGQYDLCQDSGSGRWFLVRVVD